MKTSEKTRKCILSLLIIFTWSFAAASIGADAIIDNGQPGTSYTGSWAISGGATPYGINSLWARNGATYTWQFTPEPAGNYEVLMWWSGHSSRPVNVSARINHADGNDVMTVNQKINAGQWNSLGIYNFTASGSVVITAPFGDTNSTCADAVWFKQITNISPAAIIDTITPNPADIGQNVSFAGHGIDNDGNVVGYKWISSIDGNLSNAQSFQTNQLSEGDHTISFTVFDNEGAESAPATQILTIEPPPAVSVIIDNSRPGTSYTGTWSVSNAPNPYGTNSLWSYSGATYTWSFIPTTTATYRISMWWTATSSRSTSVPVRLRAGGTTIANLTINQTQNGGQWNLLGEWPMNAGTTYTVRITAPTGSPPSTCADAVKFESMQTNKKPTAVIDSINPNPAGAGELVTFTGHGSDDDGTVVSYKWVSSIDGNLSDANTFQTDELSEGEHIITLTVTDNDGAESNPVNQTLIVESQSSVSVIIDNGQTGTSSTGTWLNSAAPNPYGLNSLWSYSGATYTWAFTPTTTAIYQVSMWWTAVSSRSTSVPVRIWDGGTIAELTINQTQNGGQWNVLGQWPMSAGTTYRVTITAPAGSPPSTCADAVRFEAGELNLIPAAVIDSITPNPAQAGQSVSFLGHGSDDDGTITAYKWFSNIDGNLSDANFFQTDQLSEGEHTITLTVYDDKGAASNPVSQSLKVGSQQAVSVIIDNGQAGTSSTGPWAISGTSNPYGPNSVWSYTGATYTWAFTPSISAVYRVSMWWTATSTRSSSVPVRIWDGATIADVTINQTQNGGQWNQIGQWPMNAGTTYRVTITAPTGSPPSTCADAVKFESGEINMPPVAVIDSIIPETAFVGDNVTFTGHGEDSNGTIESYSWTSSIDGNLSTAASFSTSSLSVGDHTITLIVYDDDGAASVPVTRSLVIQQLPAETVTIDNGDPFTSHTGIWYASSATGSYGPNSVWSRDGAAYTWTFSPAISGSYDVRMWWTQYSTRDVNIPVDIENSAGTARVYINQQQNGGKWNSLGRYGFAAGTNYNITITSQPGPSSTCADALQLVCAETNKSPVAVIDSVTPNPSIVGETVSFSGHGTDDDGTIESYLWSSNIDGVLSDQNSFSVSDLSMGDHTITLVVTDDGGAASAAASLTLTVRQQTITPVIIDNSQPGTSFTGVWTVSGAPNPYGTNSVWSYSGATYTWAFTPATTAVYRVSLWWTALASRSSSVPVRVWNGGTIAELTINQTQNGGQWNVIGQWPMNAGTTYRVTITAPAGSPPSTCADAIKFD